MDEISHELTYYYQNPDQDKLVHYILRMEKADMLDKGSTKMVLLAFLSQIFQANPQRINELKSESFLHLIRKTETFWWEHYGTAADLR